MSKMLKKKILLIILTAIVITSLFGLSGYYKIKDKKDDWFVSYSINFNQRLDILLSSLDNSFIETGVISRSASSISSVESLRVVARKGIKSMNETINSPKNINFENISNISLTDYRLVFRTNDISKSDYYAQIILKEYNNEVKKFLDRTINVYEELLIAEIKKDTFNLTNDLQKFVNIFVNIKELSNKKKEGYFTESSLNDGSWHFLDEDSKKILSQADEILNNSKPFFKSSNKNNIYVKNILENIGLSSPFIENFFLNNIELYDENIIIFKEFLLSMEFLSNKEKRFDSIKGLKEKINKADLMNLIELNHSNNSKPSASYTIISYSILGFILSILITFFALSTSKKLLLKKLATLLHPIQKS